MIESKLGIKRIDDVIKDLNKAKEIYGNAKISFSTIHQQYFDDYEIDDSSMKDTDEDFRVLDFRIR